MAPSPKIHTPDRLCRIIMMLMQDIMMTHPLRYGQTIVNALNSGLDKDTLFHLTDQELISKLSEYRDSLKIQHVVQRERTPMRKR